MPKRDLSEEQKRLESLEKKIKVARTRFKNNQRKEDSKLKILVGSYTMKDKKAFTDLVKSDDFIKYFNEKDLEFINSTCLRLFPEFFPQPESENEEQNSNTSDTQEEIHATVSEVKDDFVQDATLMDTKGKRIDLNVPKEYKDIAKGLGAKWDPINKTWYTLDGVDARNTIQLAVNEAMRTDNVGQSS